MNFYDLGESVNFLDSCESENCGESTDCEEFVDFGKYDDSGNSDEYGEPYNPGEHGKFAQFGDACESHITGNSGASDYSGYSVNSDEFVNLVILKIFYFGKSVEFGTFYYSGKLDQYG